MKLKHGENMYQAPADLFKSGPKDQFSICNFEQVAGDVPCFTNIADLDSILETLCKLHLSLKANGIGKAFIVIAAKHGNACGIGVSTKKPSEAAEAALSGNSRGIWGGEVITNFPIDGPLAKILLGKRKKWMLDVIVAPRIKNSAVKILAVNPNRKLFVNSGLSSPRLRKDKRIVRPLRGGFMLQPPADYILDLKKVFWTNALKDKSLIVPLVISWAAAFTSSHGGNETAIAKGGVLLGIGGGPATFDAAATALARAKEQGKDISGAVFGADAFFPFIDVPEILLKAGCIGGIVPAGGKREKDVVQYFKEHHMFVGMIPAPYRGFCRH